MQYRSWQVTSWLARHLPLRVSYAVATVAGWVAYYCWPRGRNAMHRNYRRVLGADATRATIRSTARRSLANYCKYLIDFARFPSEPPETLIELAHGDASFRDLDSALEGGRGALIVCMHFGNWDLGAGAAAARGYPLTVVVETFSDPRLDALVVGARERLGMNIVRMEKAGPSLYRALRSNGLLALLADQPIPGDGVTVEFFGAPIEIPAGPGRLALKSGATPVPTAFRRIDPWKPAVEVMTDFTIAFEPTGETAADVVALTREIVSRHERFIRETPDQWYMFREMWPRTAAVP